MTQDSYDSLGWLEPWRPMRDEAMRVGAEVELLREVGPGHLLYGRQVRAIGHRQDCDDVLFAFRGAPGCAVVHLTWTSRAPDTPPWPMAETFAGVDAFASDRMLADHRDYVDVDAEAT